VLMNVALHGMEEAAGVRYHPGHRDVGTAVPGCPVLIRYADDELALCHSRDQAEQVKARLAVHRARSRCTMGSNPTGSSKPYSSVRSRPKDRTTKPPRTVTTHSESRLGSRPVIGNVNVMRPKSTAWT
jgi:hypothetical protein